jgi:hypothetical protein
MDPGEINRARLKLVPNLVDEDPSIVTPKNTSFVDMPWKEFQKQLQDNREHNKKETHSKSTSTEEDITHTYPEEGSIEDFSLCNWDADTGYQHIKTSAS